MQYALNFLPYCTCPLKQGPNRYASCGVGIILRSQGIIFVEVQLSDKAVACCSYMDFFGVSNMYILPYMAQ